jgi:hypothetical protein
LSSKQQQRSTDKESWQLVQPLFDQLNATARSYMSSRHGVDKPAVAAAVDSVLIPYQGGAHLSRENNCFWDRRRLRQLCLGYRVVVLVSADGELLACQPIIDDGDGGKASGASILSTLVEQYGGGLQRISCGNTVPLSLAEVEEFAAARKHIGLTGYLLPSDVTNMAPPPPLSPPPGAALKGDDETTAGGVVYAKDGSLAVMLAEDQKQKRKKQQQQEAVGCMVSNWCDRRPGRAEQRQALAGVQQFWKNVAKYTISTPGAGVLACCGAGKFIDPVAV